MFIITFGEIPTMIFIEFHKKVPSESEIPGFSDFARYSNEPLKARL